MKASTIQKKHDVNTNEVIHFDEYGRCTPHGITAPVHACSRRYFSMVQSAIEYKNIYKRLDSYFDIATVISLDEFEQRAEAILDGLQTEVGYDNILKGVRVPFILPKAEYEDIGHSMEMIYLNAVGRSFNNQFPEYEFINQYSQSLSGKLSVADGSRHEKLIEAMGHDVVVGYFFPCLLEYSVPAARERIALLPEKFLLAGGYDMAAAFVGSPDLLLRTDGYPPLLWLSGLNADKKLAGFHFEAYGCDLTFNRRMHLANSAEYWASGLVVLG